MRGALRSFQTQLLAWYQVHHRKLPWRIVGATSHRDLDAYHVLVSEAMLQQTQVATVIPYYDRFLARFPTVQALADADEQEVLRLWQGLGYYSRARNLQKAARAIVEQHAGKVPGDVTQLLSLPGVGRYTAGAVASLAFGRRAPILDGNVARVLCRLDGIEQDPRDKETNALLWRRAEEVLPEQRLGDFNSALMELGATVCTPRAPQCLVCPVRSHCQALAAGKQESIPPARKARETPLERRLTLCVAHAGKWLIEQRPAEGRWAGMWQFVTVGESLPKLPARQLSPETVHALTELRTTAARPLAVVRHALTHRRYEFHVFACRLQGRGQANGRRWARLADLGDYPLPRPHLKIAGLLQADAG